MDLTGGTAGSGDGEGDGDEEPAGTGSNIVGALSGILGSSSVSIYDWDISRIYFRYFWPMNARFVGPY